jgi:four helix bundle protein
MRLINAYSLDVSRAYAHVMTTSSTTTGSETISDKSLKQRKADLLNRTTRFAQGVRSFVRKTPRTIASLGDCRRLVYASGAIGAHYISADESPTRQDFLRQVGGCRKEAKQSVHWLELLDANLEEGSEKMRSELLDEARELERIFGAIVGKTLANARKNDE